MADDLEIPAPDRSLVGAEPGRVRAKAPSERRRKGAYTARFGIAYAALAILVGLAVGSFVVLSGSSGGVSGGEWSTWKPNADGTARAREIADYVSRRYRLPSGAQLVGVIAGPPSVQNIPIGHFALTQGNRAEDLSVLPAGNSIAYQLCGLGERCAIREGTPSVQRGRLLHRQALELALYTFEYMDDVDSVVAFLPPPAGDPPALALFFRRSDLEEHLKRPLRATLAEQGSLTPDDLDAAETIKIARLTEDNLFQYTFQQAPDGSAVLVLAPPSA